MDDDRSQHPSVQGLADLRACCDQVVTKAVHLTGLHRDEIASLKDENARLVKELRCLGCSHKQEAVHESSLRSSAATNDSDFQNIADEAHITMSLGSGVLPSACAKPRRDGGHQLSQEACILLQAHLEEFEQETPDSTELGEAMCDHPAPTILGSMHGLAPTKDCTCGDHLTPGTEGSGTQSLTGTGTQGLSMSSEADLYASDATGERQDSKGSKSSRPAVGQTKSTASAMSAPPFQEFKMCETFVRSAVRKRRDKSRKKSGHSNLTIFTAAKEHRLTTLRTSTFPGMDEDMTGRSSGISGLSSKPSLRRTRSRLASIQPSKMCKIFTSMQNLRHPTSPLRVSWECCSALLLIYDVVTIPMEAFPIPPNGFMTAMSRIILLYWSADVFFSFINGYYGEHDQVVLSYNLIAKRYASTWLLPDLILVGMDWSVTILALLGGGGFFSADTGEGATDNMSILRAAKAFKVLRLFRLLRVMKLSGSSFVFILQDRFESESLYILANLVKNIAIILVLNHFTACIFFWTGSQTVSGYSNWTTHYEINSKPWFWGYLTAVHWSLAQFANGEILIEPQNVPERLVCIAVLLLSIVVFSSFIAIVSNTVSQLMDKKASQRRDAFVLRLYLRQHHISTALKMRVNRYTGVLITSLNERVHHDTVRLFSRLSKPLQVELLTELYAKHLALHPFFYALSIEGVAILRSLCCMAIHQQLLSRGDLLFSTGQETSNMYLVENGELAYWHTACNKKEYLGNHDWFCEAALWINSWTTTGQMTAKTEAELMAINALKFREVVTQHHTSIILPCTYAAAFVAVLNAHSKAGEYLTDCHMEFVEDEEIVKVLDIEIEDNGQGPQFNIVERMMYDEHAIDGEEEEFGGNRSSTQSVESSHRSSAQTRISLAR